MLLMHDAGWMLSFNELNGGAEDQVRQLVLASEWWGGSAVNGSDPAQNDVHAAVRRERDFLRCCHAACRCCRQGECCAPTGRSFVVRHLRFVRSRLKLVRPGHGVYSIDSTIETYRI